MAQFENRYFYFENKSAINEWLSWCFLLIYQ